MKDKRRYAALVSAGLIAAICIELCLAFFSARRGSVLEEISVVTPEYVTSRGEGQNPYLTTQEKPWLDFRPERRAGYLEFEFTEPLKGKEQVLVYYTEQEGQDFNRFRRIERWLMRGTTRGRIPLPASGYERLRLVLTGDGQIVNVSLRGTVSERPEMDALLRHARPFRFLCMAVILPVSLCLGWRERGRGKSIFLGEAGRPGFIGAGAPKPRTAWLDGVRVLAALFVIAVHVLEPVAQIQIKGTPRDYFFQSLVLIALTCNLLFFFISGALLLPYRDEPIGEYYKKRLVKILLPFAVYSLFYLKLLCATAEGVRGWPAEAALDFIGASITMGPHLWLIYKLMSLYLLVPFLRYMMVKMPQRVEKQLFLLILAVLTLKTASVYFRFDLGFSLYLDSWLGLFFAGYLLNREWMRRFDIFLMTGGILALAASVRIYGLRVDYLEIIANCSILEFLMASAIFVLMIRLNGILSRFSRMLQRLGNRSFSVLMIHLFVMSAILPLGLVPVSLENRSVGQLIIPYIFICVVSYIIAAAVDETVIRVLEAGALRISAGKRKR